MTCGRVKEKINKSEGKVVLTTLNGYGIWALNTKEKRVDMMEMDCLKTICGVRQMSQVKYDCEKKCKNKCS